MALCPTKFRNLLSLNPHLYDPTKWPRGAGPSVTLGASECLRTPRGHASFLKVTGFQSRWKGEPTQREKSYRHSGDPKGVRSFRPTVSSDRR